jgi:hypothetical protein
MFYVEFSDFWWLMPLVLMLICCFFCGRSGSCLRRFGPGRFKPHDDNDSSQDGPA